MLEFDEFMKIPGCKEGRHLFVGSKKDEVSLYTAFLTLQGNQTRDADIWQIDQGGSSQL